MEKNFKFSLISLFIYFFLALLNDQVDKHTKLKYFSGCC